MGLKYKWSDFTLTDNSCKSLDDSPTVLREKYAARLLLTEEEQIAGALTSFRGAALNTLVADEKEAEKSIVRLENGFENFLKEVSEDAKKELEVIENAIEEEVESIEGGIERGLKLRK
jgi:hypothetical protein